VGTALCARNVTRAFHNLQRKTVTPAPAVGLARKCGADDTVIHVSSTEGYPDAGVIAIGRGGKGEVIAYSGKTGSSFTGCVRGYKGTAPAAHSTRRRVKQLITAPVLNFHQLRHAAATLMLASGVNPKTAADVLGHSSVALTLNLYSHVQDETKRAAVDAVGRMIGRK
jgi:hypothetical protein